MVIIVSGRSLSRQLKYPEGKLKRQIMDFCKGIAGSCQITAACIVGDYALGLSDAKTVLEVLLVIRDLRALCGVRRSHSSLPHRQAGAEAEHRVLRLMGQGMEGLYSGHHASSGV